MLVTRVCAFVYFGTVFMRWERAGVGSAQMST